MASWVKIVNTLPRSRAIYALMRALRCKRQAALGLAVDWFCWLDENSTNGNTGMLDEEISDVLGWPGAAQALSAVGWVSHDEQGYVVAVDFDKHNGETAKKRAEDAERQRKSRYERSRGECDSCHGKSVTGVTQKALPDKIREEKKIVSPIGEPIGARPRDAQEVEAYLATVTALKLTPPERQKAAMAFYQEMESVAWIDKAGRNIWNWKAAASRWAMSWAENANTSFRAGRKAESPSRNTGTANEGRGHVYDIR